jgi:uncharacterized damage-inducible protein DinB
MKRSASRQRGQTAVLLHVLDEAFDRLAWHGTNLRGALRGVTARQADWRPAAGRHNIREVAMHIAYWKYRVRNRLTGQKGGGFPLRGNNWHDLPPVSEKQWRAERDLLDRAHGELKRTVEEFPEELLGRRLAGTQGRTAFREIAGIALHDVYHTGQIQLLKALQKNARTRRRA